MKIWVLYETDEYGEWEILKVSWRESVVRNHFIETAREILLDEPEVCRNAVLDMSVDQVGEALCNHYNGQPYYQGMGWRSIKLPLPSFSFKALRNWWGKRRKKASANPFPGEKEKS